MRMQPRFVAVLWAIMWMSPCKNTGATVNFWTCPGLHGPNTVSCTCELAHALQCRGTYSPDGLLKIVSLLRALPANNTVQVLDLKLNNFTVIPTDSFKDTNLHAMIISFADSLALLPDSFRGLEESLVALGLPSNNLRSIPTDALRALVLIEKMDFTNNKISSLSSENLAPFARLEELNLSNNNISAIDEYSFKNNKHLRKLILDGNKLSDPLFSWSKTIYNGLPVLENLSLVRTDQAERLMKQTLPRLPGLITLNLSFNNLTSVNFRAFVDLPKLQYLDISYNQLSFIDKEAFQGLNNLVKLDLSHNRLTELIQESFIGLNSLAYLNMNDNYLTAICDSLFIELKAIRFIDVRDNEIAYIHPMAFLEARFLESLDLEDNHLLCNCKMKGFAMWLKTKSSTLPPAKKRQIQCETSLGAPRAMIDMKPSELVCSNETPPESLAKIEKEESGYFTSVSPLRLQLVDYEFKMETKSLLMAWAIDSAAQPYECDAIFVFEQINRKDELRQKLKVVCDSDAEVNPRQLTIRLASVEVDRRKIYRFCLVLFSAKTLVPGCSELLRISGNRLASVSANPPSKVRAPLKGFSQLTSIHVNQSTFSPESVSVWWSFAPEVSVPDSCLLNISLLTGAKHVAADKILKCSERTVNFTDTDPLETYRVCISVLEPMDYYREDNCVAVGSSAYRMSPLPSNPVLTTVLTSVFISLACILLIAIILTARRMFWPSKKAINLISSSPQYRVLYHQPEDVGYRSNAPQNSDAAQEV